VAAILEAFISLQGDPQLPGSVERLQRIAGPLVGCWSCWSRKLARASGKPKLLAALMQPRRRATAAPWDSRWRQPRSLEQPADRE